MNHWQSDAWVATLVVGAQNMFGVGVPSKEQVAEFARLTAKRGARESEVDRLLKAKNLV